MMDVNGEAEIGTSLWPAVALAIGWAYLLALQILQNRRGKDMPLAPASGTSKALAELRSSALRTPASLAERAFDEELFLEQAGVAYEFILTNYAAGDMERLAGLLEAEFFEAFSRETERRASANETMALELVALESSAILDREFAEKAATVRVRFESELFVSEGRHAPEGSTGAATLLRAIDIWTFRREHLSGSAVWTLSATDTE
jgi:predicted lipid-binding transport protein (Tim44 family)